MMQFKKQNTKRIRCYTCSKYFKPCFSLMQHRRAEHQDPFEILVTKFANLKISEYITLYEITSFRIPFMGIHDVITIKGNFKLVRGIACKYKSFIFYFTLSSSC